MRLRSFPSETMIRSRGHGSTCGGECHSTGQIWEERTTVTVRGLDVVDSTFVLYNWVWNPDTQRDEFQPVAQIYSARAEHRADLRGALGEPKIVDVVTRGFCSSWAYQPKRVQITAPYPELD